MRDAIRAGVQLYSPLVERKCLSNILPLKSNLQRESYSNVWDDASSHEDKFHSVIQVVMKDRHMSKGVVNLPPWLRRAAEASPHVTE